MICLKTNGCLVANFNTADDAVSCNLATGSAEEDAVVNAVGSEVLVLGKFYVKDLLTDIKLIPI